jgi:hypothetical protein
MSSQPSPQARKYRLRRADAQLARLTISLTKDERDDFEKAANREGKTISRVVADAAVRTMRAENAFGPMNVAEVVQVQEDFITHQKKREGVEGGCELWFFGAEKLQFTHSRDIQKHWMKRLRDGVDHHVVWELGFHTDRKEICAFIEASHLVAESVQSSFNKQSGSTPGKIWHHALTVRSDAKIEFFNQMRSAYEDEAEIGPFFEMCDPIDLADKPDLMSLCGYSTLGAIAFVLPDSAGIGQGSVCFSCLSDKPKGDSKTIWSWLSNYEAMLLGQKIKMHRKQLTGDKLDTQNEAKQSSESKRSSKPRSPGKASNQ